MAVVQRFSYLGGKWGFLLWTCIKPFNLAMAEVMRAILSANCLSLVQLASRHGIATCALVT